MNHRPVALVVHQVGTCPFVQPGETWIIGDRELMTSGNSPKLCGAGLCSLYTKLQDLRKTLSPNAGLPDDLLLCQTAGCDTAFRMEYASLPSMTSTQKITTITGRFAPAVIPAPQPRNAGAAGTRLLPATQSSEAMPAASGPRQPPTAILSVPPAPVSPQPGTAIIAQAPPPAAPASPAINGLQPIGMGPNGTLVTPAVDLGPGGTLITSEPNLGPNGTIISPQAASDVTHSSVPKLTRRLERAPSGPNGLVKLPFLNRLPKDLAAELVTACATVRYQSGQIILMQGVVGEHLYIMAEGNAEVAKRGENNDETVLVTLGMGDCFGEMSILTGEVTSAEVRACESAAVLTLHRERLEALLLKRPVLSREFSKLLAERLKATNQSLQSELSRGILGKLSMISLLDLVQTLQQSRQTGTLVLNYSGEHGRLGFRTGSLITASAGEIQSDEAFYRLVCWPDGDFCFEASEPPSDPAVKVKSDAMGLMMEAMRRMDEARAHHAQKAEVHAS